MEFRAEAHRDQSWSTGHNGELVIHAAKGFSECAKETCDKEMFKSTLGQWTTRLVYGGADAIGVAPTLFRWGKTYFVTRRGSGRVFRRVILCYRHLEQAAAVSESASHPIRHHL
jgi:hypothetical protein